MRNRRTPRNGFNRNAVAPALQQPQRNVTFLAPTEGLRLHDPLARSDRKSARVLNNFFPTPTGARVRGGSKLHATLSSSAAVESLFTYRSGQTETFFAACDGSLFDISSVVDPATAPTAAITGQTEDLYSTAHIGNSSGDYLYAVNGSDIALIYDGTSWSKVSEATHELDYDTETGAFTVGLVVTGGTSSATGTITEIEDNGTTGTLRLKSVSGTFQDGEAITDTDTGAANADGTQTAVTATITGVDTSTLSFVWLFANRLFFIEKDTQSVWYLGVDAIGGAATEFALAGVLQRNNPLLLGGRWSYDAGDGLDDRWVVVSESGDVAVYEGTNPAAASTWTLVGTYDITRPLGKNATMKAGGDFLIATQDGIVPISQVVQKDPAALSMAAVTYNIEPLWQAEAITRTTPWDITRIDQKNMMVVALPVSSTIHDDKCLVANLETGGWCIFTGWNTNCLGTYSESGYFGTDAGLVMKMEEGGSDNGENYVAQFAGPFDGLDHVGLAKSLRQVRAVYVAGHEFKDQVSIGLDFNTEFPEPPESTVDISGNGWDLDKWDVGIWDGGGRTLKRVTTRWRSVFGSGYAVSPQIQITFGLEEIGTHAMGYDGEAVDFKAGEKITGGTSGATAIVVSLEDDGTDGTLYIKNITGTFQDNETITGPGRPQGLLLALTAAGSATTDIPNGVSELAEVTPNVELAQLDLTYEPGGLVV